MSAEQPALDFSGPINGRQSTPAASVYRRCPRAKCNNRVTQIVRRGRPQLFCSDACRKAYGRARDKDQARHEWYTPAEIVEAARQVLGGIDLYPRRVPRRTDMFQAARFYSARENGLRHPWRGRVWCNPPYGTCAEVRREVRDRVSVRPKLTCRRPALEPDAPNRQRSHPLHELAPIMLKPFRRLHFINGHTERRLSAPRNASVLLGIGVDRERFREAFARLGKVAASRRFGLPAYLV